MVRFYFDRDAKAAESDFLRSKELDPRYAQGRQFYSFMLLHNTLVAAERRAG